MKYAIISSAVLASLFIAGAANASFGGRINFEGEVVNAACAVDANSTNQTIQLGQVRSGSFNAAGQLAGKVPFSIQLNDCDTTVSSTASVGFIAVQDATDQNALAVNGGAGAATGIGIYITDASGTVVTPDGTESSAVTLIDGKNVLPFHAQYVSTDAAVTAGTANATTTFRVIYN
ncbi:type 1 fimbrial major subunit FimA [Enterobacter kobei]|uniref:type 1 fimbrial major subunit FimA n=1 Tax=Enterobacter kobei TaxID=208224 RepID=UPI003BC9D4AD